MNYKDNIRKVYIASPFFNSEQTKVVEDIKELLITLHIDYFSPKDKTQFDRNVKGSAKACFDSNIRALIDCDYMIAVIDDFDPGTIFEMGYFYSHDKNIVAYSNVEGRGLNIMLSQSCIGFANGLQELADKIVRLRSGGVLNEDFAGEQI